MRRIINFDIPAYFERIDLTKENDGKRREIVLAHQGQVVLINDHQDGANSYLLAKICVGEEKNRYFYAQMPREGREGVSVIQMAYSEVKEIIVPKHGKAFSKKLIKEEERI